MIDGILTLCQLTQCNNGIARLSMMIGAKNFAKSQEENFVSFRFMKGAANKSNHVKITLNSMDTYDIQFGYVRGLNFTVRDTFYGIYNDGLKEVFENETKLYLSLQEIVMDEFNKTYAEFKEAASEFF